MCKSIIRTGLRIHTEVHDTQKEIILIMGGSDIQCVIKANQIPH